MGKREWDWVNWIVENDYPKYSRVAITAHTLMDRIHYRRFHLTLSREEAEAVLKSHPRVTKGNGVNTYIVQCRHKVQA